ncbi:MAG: IS3 family transposase, partial [Bacteroidales bacterium]|nr:IS3 family transposase [Bacteroidales bacterium]
PEHTSEERMQIFRPRVHPKGCSDGRMLVFCPSVHPEGCFSGRTLVFHQSVHPEPPSDGRMFSYPLSVHGEAGADGQIFGLMKNELLYLQEWDSIDQFKKAFREYIRYYNRIKLRLKGKSPVQYRTLFQSKAS